MNKNLNEDITYLKSANQLDILDKSKNLKEHKTNYKETKEEP